MTERIAHPQAGKIGVVANRSDGSSGTTWRPERRYPAFPLPLERLKRGATGAGISLPQSLGLGNALLCSELRIVSIYFPAGGEFRCSILPRAEFPLRSLGWLYCFPRSQIPARQCRRCCEDVVCSLRAAMRRLANLHIALYLAFGDHHQEIKTSNDPPTFEARIKTFVLGQRRPALPHNIWFAPNGC